MVKYLVIKTGGLSYLIDGDCPMTMKYFICHKTKYLVVLYNTEYLTLFWWNFIIYMVEYITFWLECLTCLSGISYFT